MANSENTRSGSSEPSSQTHDNPPSDPSAKATVAPASQGRIASIDALRGFDMFWICGGRGLFLFLVVLIFGSVPPWLQHQMSHVSWVGFTAWDLIMPLFLFIVGVAMPFSFAKRLQTESKRQLYFKIIRRTLILFVLGMVAQGNLLQFKLASLQIYCNTLQSIAVGYFVASILLIHLRFRGQLIVTVGLLLGFWAIMSWVPIPGIEGVGHLEPKENIAKYIDQAVLGQGGTYTWVLSSMTFAASVMLGVFAGQLLRLPMRDTKKVLALLGLAMLCLVLGWVWSYWFPIIKHIWSSSMVLWAAGWSYLLLAIFYLVIDVWNFKKWSFPFIVIGSNAIFAYMFTRPFKTSAIAESAVGGLAAHLSEPLANQLVPAAHFILLWLILLYMYRKKTFIKI